MIRAVEVKPLEKYRLWVRFGDGTEGEVDLADLAGRGVFSVWDEHRGFERVYIGSSGEIAWSEDVAICPDAVYLRVTGKAPSELFPSMKQAGAHA